MIFNATDYQPKIQDGRGEVTDVRDPNNITSLANPAARGLTIKTTRSCRFMNPNHNRMPPAGELPSVSRLATQSRRFVKLIGRCNFFNPNSRKILKPMTRKCRYVKPKTISRACQWRLGRDYEWYDKELPIYELLATSPASYWRDGLRKGIEMNYLKLSA